MTATVLLGLLAGACSGAFQEPASDEAPTCRDPGPGPRLLRRLTHRQYDRTVADLLGVESDWGASFPADESVEGHRDVAAALDVDPLLLDAYQRAAEDLAARTDLEAIGPCSPSAGRPCAGTWVPWVAQRAWRRPLDEEETDRLLALWDLAEEAARAEGDEAPEEAATRAVLQSLLLSPHFLYRSELGTGDGTGRFALGPFEIASQLSYLLWDTMPDEELFAAAAAGTLLTPEGREEQALRMLADPRADETVAALVEDWLDLDLLAWAVRDVSGFTDALREDMLGEVRRVVSEVRAQGGGLPELLQPDHTWVTPELADWYGMAPPDAPVDEEGFARVPLAEPRGLLGLGAVTTAHALPTSSSPIHRGRLVRERLLCQPIPLPPPDLATPVPEAEEGVTTRERYAIHAADPACATCHDLMDPIGFAFEHFDATGRWRDTDAGRPVDATGWIVGSEATDGAFDGAAELAAHLAASEEVATCFTTWWTTAAWGTPDDPDLACAVPVIAADRAARGGRLDDLLLALLGHPHLVERTGGPEEGEAPAADAEWLVEPSEEERQAAVEVDWSTTSEWNTGACLLATVRNAGGWPVDWVVVADLGGALDTWWDAEADPLPDGTVRFSGASWNRTLQPGASTTFGACVTWEGT